MKPQACTAEGGIEVASGQENLLTVFDFDYALNEGHWSLRVST